MMVVVARWTVKSNFLSKALSLLADLQHASRKESGNITYEFYQDPILTQNILIYEEYKNVEAIEAHRMNKHFQDIVVKQILPNLEERNVSVFEHADK